MKAEKIKTFLDEFGTKVRKDDDTPYVELMMDDHHCIKWEGVEYYIPENNSCYSDKDESIVEFLSTKHHV